MGLQWWAYLHANGEIIVKRWHGDHADYTTDCEGNEFVQKVLPPFEAENHAAAYEIADRELRA